MAMDTRTELMLRALGGHLGVVEQIFQASRVDSICIVAALLRQLVDEGRTSAHGALMRQVLHGQDPALAETLFAVATTTSSSWGVADDVPLEVDLSGVADPFAGFELQPPPAADGPVDAEAIGLELVPVPASEPADLDPAAVRRHPRFVSRHQVLVALGGRDELKALWTHDISAGGLFVITDDQPSKGTQVGIKLHTPDGDLDLNGMVVRTVDNAAAAATGDVAGVGVRFTDLTAERRQVLERYIAGVSQHLRAEAAVEVPAGSDELLPRARRLLAQFDAAEYYGAIDLAAAARDTEVQQRIAELTTLFSQAAGVGSPEQRDIVQQASRAHERIQKTQATTTRRLTYDFTHGHVRSVERLAEAAAAGQSAEDLRATWHTIFPEKLAEAQTLSARAVAASRQHDYIDACVCTGEAIALDPFNPLLRERVARWEVYARVARDSQESNVDANAIVAWAAERGVDAGQLRTLWSTLQPARVDRAAKLVERAGAARRAGQIDVAVATASEALQHDPFNVGLRNAIANWRQPQ